MKRTSRPIYRRLTPLRPCRKKCEPMENWRPWLQKHGLSDYAGTADAAACPAGLENALEAALREGMAARGKSGGLNRCVPLPAMRLRPN